LRSGTLRRVFPAVVLASGVAAGVMVPAQAEAATAWSAPVTLATLTDSSSTTLTTAGRASGPAVVVWTNNSQINARVLAASGGWSATATLSPAAETAMAPSAVVRPDGSVVVAWAAQRSADWVIEAAVRSVSGTWAAPVVVSGSLTWAGPLQLGADGSGNVLAAWAQITSSVRSVTTATLPATGTWSAPATIATPSASTIRQVSVAVNASGAAVVGWIRQAGDLYGDVVTRPAGGAFGAPVTIATGFLRPLQDQLHALRVSIDPAGRTSAAWNVVYAYASAQQSDGRWAPATVFASGSTSNVAMALDTTGTTQLLWTLNGVTQSSSLPPGGTWAPATAVLPGSSPMDLGIAPNGATEFAGFYDTRATAISAATHTASGWSAATRVSSVFAPLTWVAGVGTAPAGGGALIAWITGITAQGTVQVSIGTSS
jgi:hypothetical protein